MGTKGKRIALVFGSAAVIATALTAIVRAEDDDLRALISRAARPLRVMTTGAVPVPTLFRRAPMPVEANGRGFAAGTIPTVQPLPETMGLSRNRAAERVAFAPRAAFDRGRNASRLPVERITGKFCVRLCDGFYFPAGPALDGSSKTVETLCQAQCPEAQTAVYTAVAASDGMAKALGPQGKPYGLLPAAFQFQQRRVSACQCRAVSEPLNFAAIAGDVTVRRDDLVLTPVGFRAFGADGKGAPLRALRIHKLNRPERLLIARSEAPSLRGQLTQAAPDALKVRVGREIRLAEGKGNGFLPFVVRPVAIFDGPVRVVNAGRVGFSAPDRRITIVR